MFPNYFLQWFHFLIGLVQHNVEETTQLEIGFLHSFAFKPCSVSYTQLVNTTHTDTNLFKKLKFYDTNVWVSMFLIHLLKLVL